MISARSGARVRRVGRHSVVDIDGLRTLAVSEQVDRLGFGTYQWITLACLGIALISDAVEGTAGEPLNRALDIAFQLPLWARAALPLVHSVGGLIGLALAGPVCDQYGRKSTLVCSQALIGVSCLALAALPMSASATMILLVRLCQGFACGFGTPCIYVLLIESCPTSQRTALMYGAHGLQAVGYFVGALGLQAFMPGLGEDPNDRWRVFSIFVATPALLGLPLVMALLSESPYFYGARADTNSCVNVLNAMARRNHKDALIERLVIPEPSAVKKTADWALSFKVTMAMLFAEAPAICCLCIIDGGRTFMTSGSAYLWPQLFVESDTKSFISPASMNSIACMSPFVGLACCAAFSWVGTRRITFIVSGVAATGLLALTHTSIRATPLTLLLCVILVKCCYGPLHASVSLMKTAAFPTEVRATSFAIITVVAGFGRTAAPTLAELMKGDSDVWESRSVVGYLMVLVGATVAGGLMVLLVPAACDTSAPLEDFVADGSKAEQAGFSKGRTSLLESYGATVTSIWSTNSNDSSSDEHSGSDSNGKKKKRLKAGVDRKQTDAGQVQDNDSLEGGTGGDSKHIDAGQGEDNNSLEGDTGSVKMQVEGNKPSSISITPP